VCSRVVGTAVAVRFVYVGPRRCRQSTSVMGTAARARCDPVGCRSTGALHGHRDSVDLAGETPRRATRRRHSLRSRSATRCALPSLRFNGRRPPSRCNGSQQPTHDTPGTFANEARTCAGRLSASIERAAPKLASSLRSRLVVVASDAQLVNRPSSVAADRFA